MEVKCKCGSSDYRTEQSGQHLKAVCNACDSYIRFIPQENSIHRMPFGKLKNTPVKEVDDKKYLQWFLDNTQVKGTLRLAIENRIKHLN